MDYTKDITIHIKGKHFSIGDRRELQGMLSGLTKRPSLRALAKHFNFSPNTIRHELKRGAHPNTGRYGARRAQNDYDLKHQHSVKKYRRFLASSFVAWVESKVLKKLGRSIDERPYNIESRNEFGHWEIDTVIGRKTKGDKVVLTLVERLTRKYIALQIAGKNSAAVATGIASLKKYFGSKFSEVFKTITSDNGVDFALVNKWS